MATLKTTSAEFNPETATLEEVQRQIALLQFKQAKKIEDAEIEALHQANAVRKASAAAITMQRSHQKDNGRTALVGTRDSRGVEIFLCQRCSKDFTAQDLESTNLRPDHKTIGGPIVGWLGEI